MFRVLPYGLFQSRTNLERDGPLQFEQRNQLVDLLKRSKLRPERSNVHIFGKNTDPSVLLVVGYLGSTGFIADNLPHRLILERVRHELTWFLTSGFGLVYDLRSVVEDKFQFAVTIRTIPTWIRWTMAAPAPVAVGCRGHCLMLEGSS
ncbi:hypothetical protein BU26DRAFT_498688 [Trematosphaeria pertusa]|uniref:Uncharacterized protein n=1 Tax=Trematosphaeria pertusa TaxID=390896 RepID=A0A6A6J0B3_9PLEO|nr:uncharacterized protein BU26DRAFT_498688 [Trematosphaeria pertusa]KAF2255938.1 hypothetical protein BU26DRAFT_498688 [Trematosphaeria pertusa]